MKKKTVKRVVKAKKATRPKKKSEWVLAGECGVDSGQILITDPCYIDSEWVKNTEFVDERKVTVKETGETIEAPKGHQVNGMTWEDEFIYKKKGYNMTWNQARAKGIITPVKDKPLPQFSYNGACKTTIAQQYGQLSNAMAPLAVVSRTAYGDGIYPVYVKLDKDGRVKEVKIKFA
jgi:hypothetical protein